MRNEVGNSGQPHRFTGFKQLSLQFTRVSIGRTVSVHLIDEPRALFQGYHAVVTEIMLREYKALGSSAFCREQTFIGRRVTGESSKLIPAVYTDAETLIQISKVQEK